MALVKDYIAVMGLTNKQFAALVGAGYAIGDSSNCAGLFCRRNSFHTSGSSVSSVLSNIYFKDLLSNSWQEYNSTSNGNIMYKVCCIIINHNVLFCYELKILSNSKYFLIYLTVSG